MREYCVVFSLFIGNKVEYDYCNLKARSYNIAVWKCKKFYLERYGNFNLIDVYY